MPATKKRAGARFYKGDDLTKTGADRKRVSKSEPWEKKRATKKTAKKAAKKATKKATKKSARKTGKRTTSARKK